MQSIHSIETQAYGTTKVLVSAKEEIKRNNIVKRYKKWLTLMMLLKNIKEYNLNWPQIPNYPNRILINGGLGSGKTSFFFNLLNPQSDID